MRCGAGDGRRAEQLHVRRTHRERLVLSVEPHFVTSRLRHKGDEGAARAVEIRPRLQVDELHRHTVRHRGPRLRASGLGGQPTCDELHHPCHAGALGVSTQRDGLEGLAAVWRERGREARREGGNAGVAARSTDELADLVSLFIVKPFGHVGRLSPGQQRLEEGHARPSVSTGD